MRLRSVLDTRLMESVVLQIHINSIVSIVRSLSKTRNIVNYNKVIIIINIIIATVIQWPIPHYREIADED